MVLMTISQVAPISWQLFQEEGSGSIWQPASYKDANVFFDPKIYVDRDVSSSSKGFVNSEQRDLWPLIQHMNASLSLDDIGNRGGVLLDSDIVFPQESSRLLEEFNHETRPDNRMNVSTAAREKALRVSKSFHGKFNVNAEADSTVKRQEHNARERERRMRLSSSYLTLRSLLPNSRRSKKRWSSSTIIEKVLEYIPCVEKEIENLNHKKKELVATIKSDKKKMSEKETLDDGSKPAQTVSVVEIEGGVEVIIQIFMKSWWHGEDGFSSLIEKLEERGLKVVSASTAVVGGHRLSCHLHMQLEDGDKFPISREKVVSWLSRVE